MSPQPHAGQVPEKADAHSRRGSAALAPGLEGLPEFSLVELHVAVEAVLIAHEARLFQGFGQELRIHALFEIGKRKPALATVGRADLGEGDVPKGLPAPLLGRRVLEGDAPALLGVDHAGARMAEVAGLADDVVVASLLEAVGRKSLAACHDVPGEGLHAVGQDGVAQRLVDIADHGLLLDLKSA